MIKLHIRWKWLNSLTSTQWSRHLPQPTSRRDSEGQIDKPMHSSPWEKTSGVATNVYLRKTLEKPKRGLWISKMRVRELFTHGEGISTPQACHKERLPLIECVQRDFRIIYFFLFIFFIFWGVDKGVSLAPTYPQVRWGIQTYVVL